MFLTTQYLEEADVARRPRSGSSTTGTIVAEGTPGAAEGRDRQPDRRGHAGRARARRPARRAAVGLRRAAAQRPRQRHRAAARRRGRSWPRSSACSTRPTCTSQSLQLHQPSLDDVFLAKTGRKLEGAADDASDERRRSRRRSRAEAPWPLTRQLALRALPPVSAQACSSRSLAVARRSVVRTSRQRALLIFPMVFPLILFAINGSALSAGDADPRLPDRQLPRLPDRDAVHPGRACSSSITAGVDLARDIETGFLNRLALTPLRGEALLIGQLGGALVLGVRPGGRLPAGRARDRRRRSRAASAARSCCWCSRS